MYSAQTMVRVQILRYISRPKYTRQSPDCPLVIFSFTALPSCLHCSTSYSSAFAQHCIVAYPAPSPCCTRVHPHHLYPPRVSPSDPVSLLQVRPLPAISSESQQVLHIQCSISRMRLGPLRIQVESLLSLQTIGLCVLHSNFGQTSRTCLCLNLFSLRLSA